MKLNRRILVVGGGSAGRRHLRNLHRLGCDVAVVDPRKDRIAESSSETPLLGGFEEIDQALHSGTTFDGAVVASPPVYHVPQTLALMQAKVPVLLEKPLATTLVDAKRLLSALRNAADVPVLLGYTYRWWPPLLEFRRAILDEDLGKPLHARFVMSAHLADWHPWERYQDFFMAKTAEGGGALLDESHFLDLLLWIFGKPSKLFARIEKISALEIETDDNVDIVLSYESGFRAYIHLDLFGRPHEKFITVVCENGTVEWSFEPNRIRTCVSADQKWDERFFTFERNDMFVALAQEFLDVIDQRGHIRCTVADGVEVLDLVDAARRSSNEGNMVVIK